MSGSFLSAQDCNEIISSVLQPDQLANSFDSTIVSAIGDLTQGTRFEDNWIINSSPQSKGQLAIIILGENTNSIGRLFKGNCAFTGCDNVIVCDSTFLSGFVESLKLYDGWPQSEDRYRLANYWFQYWVLGHEIGHSLNNTFGSFRMSHKGFKSEVLNTSLEQQEELDADSFIIGRLTREKYTKLTSFLTKLLNYEIQQKIGETPHGVGIHYDYNNEKVIEYFRYGTHPEFVIRLSRLLYLIALETDDPGWKQAIEEFMIHLKGEEDK